MAKSRENIHGTFTTKHPLRE